MAYSSGDDVALSSYKTGNASATMESKQLTLIYEFGKNAQDSVNEVTNTQN